MWKLPVIFNWVITSSAIASVLICIILLVKFIVRNRQSSNWHYYIWFILLAKLLIPYTPVSPISILNVVTPAIEKLPVNQINILDSTQKYMAIESESTDAPSKIALQQNNTANDNVIPYKNNEVNSFNNMLWHKNILLLVWLSGVLVFGIYIIFINLRLLIKVKSSSTSDTSSLDKILDNCKLKLNIKSSVPIIITNDVSAPSLFGCIRPVLLLPDNVVKKLDESELEHVFLHELSHLKRKDNFVNWLIVFLKAMHWFNPIIWYGFYKMHHDCEISCDAMAMSYMSHEKQASYGYTIIHLLKIVSKRELVPGTIGILSGKSEMKRRVTMISSFNKKYVKCSVVGLIMLIVLSCILLTNAKGSYFGTEKQIQPETKTAASANSTENPKQSSDAISVSSMTDSKNKNNSLISQNEKKDLPKDSSKEVNPTEKIGGDINNKNSISPQTAKVSGKVKLYEGRYFDESTYGDHVLTTYCEVAISNVTDTSFDFAIYQVNAQTREKKVIFLKNTAVFTGDGTKAAFYGKDYTLNFTFPYGHGALPIVTDMEISGFEPLAGKTYVNNAIPGHEFG